MSGPLLLLLVLATLRTCAAGLTANGGFESQFWMVNEPGVFFANLTLWEPSDLVGTLLTFPVMFDIVSVETNMCFSHIHAYNNTLSFNQTGRLPSEYAAWLRVALVVPAGRPVSSDVASQVSYFHSSDGQAMGTSNVYTVPRISRDVRAVVDVDFSGSDLQQVAPACSGSGASVDVVGWVDGWGDAQGVVVDLHYDAIGLLVTKDSVVFDSRFECDANMTSCKANQPLPVGSNFFLRFKVTHTELRCVASAADFLSIFIGGANLDSSVKSLRQVYGVSACSPKTVMPKVYMALRNANAAGLTYGAGADIAYNVSFHNAVRGMSARFMVFFPASRPVFALRDISAPEGLNVDCLSFETSTEGNILSCTAHNITATSYQMQHITFSGKVTNMPAHMTAFSPSLTHIGCLNDIGGSWVSQEYESDRFEAGTDLLLSVETSGGIVMTAGKPNVNRAFAKFTSSGPSTAKDVLLTLVAPTTGFRFLNITRDPSGHMRSKECDISPSGSRISCHIPEMPPSNPPFTVWYWYAYDGSPDLGLVENRMVARGSGGAFTSERFDPLVCA